MILNREGRTGGEYITYLHAHVLWTRIRTYTYIREQFDIMQIIRPRRTSLAPGTRWGYRVPQLPGSINHLSSRNGHTLAVYRVAPEIDSINQCVGSVVTPTVEFL